MQTLSEKHLSTVCATLKVLANPQRFRILSHLLQGETAVGDLETLLDIKQPNLSHELRKLRQSNIVTTRRQSKVMFYSISDTATETIIKQLTNLFLDGQTNSSVSPAQGAFSHHANPGLHNNIGDHVFDAHKVNGECGQFSTVHYR